MTTFDNSGINQIEIQGEVSKLQGMKTSKGNDLWINVTWFGGEKSAALVKANPKVALVRGRLITNSYDSKKTPGEKVYEIKIMANAIEVIKQDAPAPETKQDGIPGPDEDIPF